MNALATVINHTTVGAISGTTFGVILAAVTLGPSAGKHTVEFAFKFCITVFATAGAVIGLCSGLAEACHVAPNRYQLKASCSFFNGSSSVHQSNENQNASSQFKSKQGSTF